MKYLLIAVAGCMAIGCGFLASAQSPAQTNANTAALISSDAAPGGCNFVDPSTSGASTLEQGGAAPPAIGFDPSNLDRAINPCDNFFLFADGGWIKKNPIPAAYGTWGTFNQLQDRNEDVLHQILEDAAKNTSAPAGSVEQKIGDYYASCMNTDAIDKAGIGPLEPELKRIEAISNQQDLQKELAHLQSFGVNAVFNFESTQDYKDSTQQIGEASQGGLGLPDRDYYTKTDAKSVQLRDEYLQHVTKMFGLLGENDAAAAADAKTVMAIETKLAQSSMTRVDQRNPDNTWHKMDMASLKSLTPDFAWRSYFVDLGFPQIQSVNVAEPDFFKGLNAQLSATPLSDWKTYLRWHLVHASAAALPEKFVDENFNFYGKTLTGAKEILPRWKRCVHSTDGQLGEALGQIYVKKQFPPQAKKAALDMVENLIGALRDDINTLDWMGPATKKQALEKLDLMQLKIGYPDKWRDYSAYQVVRGSYMEDLWRGDQFEFHRDLAKIGKPVDRTEWEMTPPTVNAYYDPSMNEIVFPAGILQPPFFDPNRDASFNYGGIGAVIGHEMTHGFDDEGRKFDAHGNLRNWWTPQDQKNFEARAECIIKQFDSFEVEPGLHENGHLVVGESIADLGGLTIAHNAYEKYIQNHPAPPKIDGFSPDQRFFLSFAEIWATSGRPEMERLRVATDPHALPRFRTNGPLSNMPSFAKAFGCSAGSPMARPTSERCRIW